MGSFKRLKNQFGQGTVEYIIIVSLILTGLLAGYILFNKQVNRRILSVAGRLNLIEPDRAATGEAQSSGRLGANDGVYASKSAGRNNRGGSVANKKGRAGPAHAGPHESEPSDEGRPGYQVIVFIILLVAGALYIFVIGSKTKH